MKEAVKSRVWGINGPKGEDLGICRESKRERREQKLWGRTETHWRFNFTPKIKI